MIESTQIYAHFASEVYDDFGEKQANMPFKRSANGV